MTEALADDLRGWVEAETGSAVRSAATIGRGASRRIWAVDLERSCPLVVREDTGAGPVAGTSLTLAREAAVYQAVAGADLPVPALHSVSPDGRALLLDRAPGVDHFKEAGDDERVDVTADYGRCLARLHGLDVDRLELGELAVPAGVSPTQRDLDLWQSIHETRSGTWATPVVAAALPWLREHEPSPGSRPVLCHGDAGPGNFLHRDGRVTAMLDWEFAHVGDPHDDLAWVAVRNQVLRRPIDLAVAYRAWRDEAGGEIAVDLLEWFRALVLVRMLISCDATIAWAAGDETGAAQVQAILRPFLAVALPEALRRAGATDPGLAELEEEARRRWEGSTVASILGDPSALDDLGAAL